MLSVSSYQPGHVARCRSRVDADIAAFSALDSPPEAFELAYFTNLVLALDRYFLHRMRAAEGKDGNPLNEVRIICDSLTEHAGVFTVPKTIRLDPDRTVLGLAPGDAVQVDAAGFARLAEAFLAEIEARYA